ncbi:MAG: SDR family NAD(P)-dependent oxidoreductase [Eubacteriales bacterium]
MSKIAVITGATGGIGRKNALELGRMGYTVIINGIDDNQAKECISLLEAEKITCEYMNFNVCDEEAMDKGIKAIGEKYGVIDVLVNNAGGLGGRQRFEEMETSFFRNVMALNLDSAFFASRAAIPYLKKSQNNPCIINFCSNASYNGGGPGAGIYGVSKGGVLLLTRALAKDLAEYGIRVNAVSPGTIDTDFHAQIKATKPEVFESWKNNILLKRLGQPEEVASVVGFLVSEKASFLTGEVIQINGGQDFM